MTLQIVKHDPNDKGYSEEKAYSVVRLLIDEYGVSTSETLYEFIPMEEATNLLVSTMENDFADRLSRLISISNKEKDIEDNYEKAFADYTIKAIGDDRIRGYGVLWGDKDRKDLHGEYFTKDTKGLTVFFDAVGGVPFLYQHAKDGTLKYTPIGVVDKMGIDDDGLWYEAKIKEHELYRRYIKPLVDNEKLFSSSGTIGGGKSVTKDGHITDWPIVEMTGTHTPAEWRMIERPLSETKELYKSIIPDSALAELDNVHKSLHLTDEEEVSTGDEESAEKSKSDVERGIRVKIQNTKLRLHKHLE